jgi:hypothetical protein
MLAQNLLIIMINYGSLSLLRDFERGALSFCDKRVNTING